MTSLRLATVAAGGALLALALAGPALAKSARCYTSNDGYYTCNFTAIEGDGSFVIRARGYPTYTLMIDRPGVAWGDVAFGGRSLSLPGRFLRQRDDGACWRNPEADLEICAW